MEYTITGSESSNAWRGEESGPEFLITIESTTVDWFDSDQFKPYYSNDTTDPFHTNSLHLPEEMTKISWSWITIYFIVFVVASLGNLLEFVAVWKRIKKRRTPMNVLLLNLCTADLLVVIFVIAVEIAWRISIGWYAGPVMCKFLQFCRAFSLYLSSLVLICLTLDRYYAVLYPLKVVDATRRVKIFLIVAWIVSALLAAPQCAVFDVRRHPKYETFTQCTTVGDLVEQINTILSICFMYFVPLVFIVFSYGSIIYTLTRETEITSPQSSSTGNLPLRRSNRSLMDRAKVRALKMTFTIVVVFLLCWTPYIVISTWHIVDRDSAEKVDPYLQEVLFIMVTANSSVNPLVYGVFHSGKYQQSTSTPSTAFTMSTYHHQRASRRNTNAINTSSERTAKRTVSIRSSNTPIDNAAEESPSLQIHSVYVANNGVNENCKYVTAGGSSGTAKTNLRGSVERNRLISQSESQTSV